MKPIAVSVTVPHARPDVYDFLDVLGNHRPFTDHMLVDWELSGPQRGVGAKARMRAKAPGPKQWADMTVVDAEPGVRITEEAVGAKGARRTRGTYVLADAPGGGTLITFTLQLLEAPPAERLVSPLTRIWLQRANARAMTRLAEELARG
jgi:hypothetical protein